MESEQNKKPPTKSKLKCFLLEPLTQTQNKMGLQWEKTRLWSAEKKRQNELSHRECKDQLYHKLQYRPDLSVFSRRRLVRTRWGVCRK